MAQLVGVLFYLWRSLSQRIVRRAVERLSDLTPRRGERGILIMLGCVLLVTSSFAGMSEEVRRFDHNNDGKPDQWEHYRDGMLLRVEVDRNRDGRVDEWTFYEDGKPVRAEFDSTGNGQVNQWLFYDTDGQVIRAEHDQHAKGCPDQWEYFTPGSKEPYKVERDTNGDSKADTVWEKGASASAKPR
jgi:hypothetical protein